MGVGDRGIEGIKGGGKHKLEFVESTLIGLRGLNEGRNVFITLSGKEE